MTEKYGIEEYLKEFEEILNEKPVQAGGKPGLLEQLKTKAGLNKAKDERV